MKALADINDEIHDLLLGPLAIMLDKEEERLSELLSQLR